MIYRLDHFIIYHIFTAYDIFFTFYSDVVIYTVRQKNPTLLSHAEQIDLTSAIMRGKQCLTNSLHYRKVPMSCKVVVLVKQDFGAMNCVCCAFICTYSSWLYSLFRSSVSTEDPIVFAFFFSIIIFFCHVLSKKLQPIFM